MKKLLLGLLSLSFISLYAQIGSFNGINLNINYSSTNELPVDWQIPQFNSQLSIPFYSFTTNFFMVISQWLIGFSDETGIFFNQTISEAKVRNFYKTNFDIEFGKSLILRSKTISFITLSFGKLNYGLIVKNPTDQAITLNNQVFPSKSKTSLTYKQPYLGINWNFTFKSGKSSWILFYLKSKIFETSKPIFSFGIGYYYGNFINTTSTEEPSELTNL